jgi:hypothetical protein
MDDGGLLDGLFVELGQALREGLAGERDIPGEEFIVALGGGEHDAVDVVEEQAGGHGERLGRGG